ncbi:serine/threonine protein kinase [Corchorus olitorius]|uniref:Serine/threonine protein kinase n=1 Tax=Corchorus olitorius TaxID=93759 RepID=A0A1R3J1J9_9ROSI|nr:serine/threonine protein kinase [Corchorus olitorius]
MAPNAMELIMRYLELEQKEDSRQQVTLMVKQFRFDSFRGDLEETKATTELGRLGRTDLQLLSSIRVPVKLRCGGAWCSKWRRQFQVKDLGG